MSKNSTIISKIIKISPKRLQTLTIQLEITLNAFMLKTKPASRCRSWLRLITNSYILLSHNLNKTLLDLRRGSLLCSCWGMEKRLLGSRIWIATETSRRALVVGPLYKKNFLKKFGAPSCPRPCAVTQLAHAQGRAWRYWFERHVALIFSGKNWKIEFIMGVDGATLQPTQPRPTVWFRQAQIVIGSDRILT